MAINQLQLPGYATTPVMDFSPLGQLGDLYRQAQMRRAVSDVGQQIQSGQPLDYQQIAGKLISAGVPLDQGLSLLALGQGQKASAEFGRDLGGVFGGASPSPQGSTVAPVSAGVTSAPRALPDTPPMTQARPPVPSTSRVWGDREAEAAGLYEPSTPTRSPMASNSQIAPAVSGPSMGGVPLANAVPTLIRAISNPSLPAAQKEVAKTLLTKALDDAKLTDEQKEYVWHQAQGGKETFTEWKKDIKRSGATNVQVNTGDKAYEGKVGGALGEQFVELQKGAQNASGKLNTLSYMESLINKPGFYSGTGGELVNQGKKALSSIGLADPKAASATEIFSSMANQLVLDASGGSLGAQISNADREFIQRTVPSLSTTVEGNRELINVSRKLTLRQQEVAKLAREYAKANNGKIDAGFQDALSQWAEQNPLFPPQRERALTPLPKIQEGMTATNPQTGQRLMFQGGKWVPAQGL